jgi:hypothetical protein
VNLRIDGNSGHGTVAPGKEVDNAPHNVANVDILRLLLAVVTVEPACEYGLLNLFGAKLGPLDLCAHGLGNFVRGRLGPILHAATDRAKCHNDVAAPCCDGGIDILQIACIERDAALNSRKERKQENVDIDPDAILQHQTGIGRARLAIEPERERPVGAIER